MRKHTRRTPAMFSKASDQIVNINGNLIVKVPHCSIWRKIAFLLLYARQSTFAKKRIERPAIFSVQVDAYEIIIQCFHAKCC